MTHDEFDDYIDRLWSEYDLNSAELVKAERLARETGIVSDELRLLRMRVEGMELGVQERQQRYHDGHYRHGYPSDYAEVMGRT